MTTSSSNFLVFDSKTGSQSEDAGLIYCSSKDANVQWPKSVRRGRPRKDLKEHGPSLQEVERPSKERYEFVDCLDGRRPNDPNTRKFVRTHVMHDYRRQKQIAANAKPGLQVVEIEIRDNDAKSIVDLERLPIPSPKRGSRDPFDSFPIKMQPDMHDLLYLYVSAFAEKLYPIETYWGFNPSKRFWVPLALTDPALLSAILWVSDNFQARLIGQKERPSGINHLQQAIRFLNERLQSPSQVISDTTIAAVASLALLEQSIGKQENWRIHMRGIKRMVEMRGGLSAIKCNPILHDKLCRADICGSSYGYSRPYLQVESSSMQQSTLGGCDETERPIAPGFQAIHDDYGFDSDLYDILHELHSVNQDMNTMNPLQSEVIPLRLMKRIRSIQYYLLSRENFNDISGSGDKLLKACRLGMWLYVGIIQNDFWVASISKELIWQLKSCLEKESSATDSVHALHLWLTFLAGSVVNDPTEKLWFISSIIQAASQLSLPNWCDVKLILETFAWAGKVQDKSGGDLWDGAMNIQALLQE